LDKQQMLSAGKVFEKKLLGECPLKIGGFMYFVDSIKLIITATRRLQLKEDRYTEFVKEFINVLSKKLSCNNKNIEFFSALETPLDNYHGVDGFFVFWKNSKKNICRFATIDVSLRQKVSFRANFLVTDRDIIEKKAIEIANYLKKNKKGRCRNFLII